MINPKKELFKWGPLDGHVIYGETFMHAFPHRLFDKDWPECILFYSREKLTAILENNPLREHGKILFTKYILPEDTCKKYYHTLGLFFVMRFRICSTVMHFSCIN